MEKSGVVMYAAAIAGWLPAVLMAMGMVLARRHAQPAAAVWRQFSWLSWGALGVAAVALAMHWISPAPAMPAIPPALAMTPLGLAVAVLVQFLGTVIGVFSSRYLDGEPGQGRYAAALAGVLAAVHLLLLADHWLLLIAAWAAVGIALQSLLCFYPDRPFALLAAHKKRLADRVADGLLLVAAALAWSEVGSGSLSELAHHIDREGAGMLLQLSAACLVLAVILRSALLPVHGWLIQVMEAPTPVSALLHAGVVNLGGYVLIRFAPLLEASAVARWLLVILGLGTALLAGLVMLTRISIKVRLAWSTVAQMGFMLLECGLGLYMLAALHLIGHSLYKAHAFLSASGIVQHSRLQMMRGRTRYAPFSLVLAPVLALVIVGGVTSQALAAAWPWWWSVVLALAWAPMLWLPQAADAGPRLLAWRATAGIAMVALLSSLACLAHLLPLGLTDRPDRAAGVAAVLGLALMYLVLAMLQSRAPVLEGWRRWSYAGFYVDELYTRLALRVWPTRWAPVGTDKPGNAALRVSLK